MSRIVVSENIAKCLNVYKTFYRLSTHTNLSFIQVPTVSLKNKSDDDMTYLGNDLPYVIVSNKDFKLNNTSTFYLEIRPILSECHILDRNNVQRFWLNMILSIGLNECLTETINNKRRIWDLWSICTINNKGSTAQVMSRGAELLVTWDYYITNTWSFLLILQFATFSANAFSLQYSIITYHNWNVHCLPQFMICRLFIN